jgi:Uma2 family endonuclease
MKAEEPIVSYDQLDLNKSYTYWDYLKWQFSERVELIRGRLFKMSPAPTRTHQKVITGLIYRMYTVLEKHPCELYSAPFDVRLPVPKAGKDSTVVQPDICVICNLSKLDERGCNGAPDLIVEIVSPNNSKHDMVTKFELYQESGVKEYWIVQPESKSILIYSLQNERYIGLPPLTEGQKINSPLFPMIDFEVEGVFD